MKTITRKSFFKKTAISTMAASSIIAACSSEKEKSPTDININFNKKIKWKMVTTWPPNFPVLGEGCNLFADWIRDMSGGRLDIRVFGGGELVPSLESFEAVSGGAVEIGHGCAYYWAGKSPGATFFATVPFGMNAQQMNAWLYAGGGYELYKSTYEKFNVIPFIGGNTGVQMAGWFNKEINSISDFKGLKMRIPGLGGKVLQRVGGTAVLSSGSEIYTNLERGVIDATEWIGPYHDYLMGFHKIAKYYYYPGWHEPGTTLEVFVNRRKLEQLPADLQAIVEVASYRLNAYMIAEFEAKNNDYLNKIKAESTAEIRILPEEVINQLRINANEIVQKLANSTPETKKIADSFFAFRNSVSLWSNLAEKVFYNSIQRS